MRGSISFRAARTRRLAAAAALAGLLTGGSQACRTEETGRPPSACHPSPCPAATPFCVERSGEASCECYPDQSLQPNGTCGYGSSCDGFDCGPYAVCQQGGPGTSCICIEGFELDANNSECVPIGAGGGAAGGSGGTNGAGNSAGAGGN